MSYIMQCRIRESNGAFLEEIPIAGWSKQKFKDHFELILWALGILFIQILYTWIHR